MRLLTTGKDSNMVWEKLLRMNTMVTLNTMDCLLLSWREGFMSFFIRETRSGLKNWKPHCDARRRSSSRKKWRCACGRTRLNSRYDKTMSCNEEIAELAYFLRTIHRLYMITHEGEFWDCCMKRGKHWSSPLSAVQ